MSLLLILQTIPDFRGARGQRYPLSLVLLIIIIGALCGYWGYRPLADFGARYATQLRSVLGLSATQVLPSYSTLRRVMQGLDFQAFSTAFAQWVEQSLPPIEGEWYAVDGKSLGSTLTKVYEPEQNFLTLVSVFSQQRGLVLALQAMENRAESEIEVLKRVLSTLQLQGTVVTMDALHAQKATLRQIVEQGGHYLVSLKGNQHRFYQWMQQQCGQEHWSSSYVFSQQGHGRQVTRRVFVSQGVGDFDKSWYGLRSWICIERTGLRQGVAFRQRQFYISDLAWSAEQFAPLIQGHWLIENQLHWVKDVVLGEDDAPHSQHNAAVNWSILRNFFINVARQLGYQSMAKAKRELANQVDLVALHLK
jgi:predicted transposase YbfD/YdcC